MHRMRRLVVSLGLSIVATVALAPKASAALLHPADDASIFPDLSAGYVSGTQHYTASTGQFVVVDTPYAMAFGQQGSQQFDIGATADGTRRQTIIAQLDNTGKLDPTGSNLYEVDGSVTMAGKTYSGILLQGTITGFGSQNTSATAANTAMYDMNVKITGGLLAQSFGTDTYVRLTAERWSTFTGDFTHDFSGGKVASNIRGFYQVPPAPVPEPTTLVVLIAAGGAGLFFRHRRRISRDELEAA